ncbi:hypothetical protein TNCV_2572281 [Trichonephila clavipes]|nr:hypothetical protein TNCV_2572281 [Trichonephila clavipes]
MFNCLHNISSVAQARLFLIYPEGPEDVIFSDKALERLPKLSSTASKRSKASSIFFITLHIIDMPVRPLTVYRGFGSFGSERIFPSRSYLILSLSLFLFSKSLSIIHHL